MKISRFFILAAALPVMWACSSDNEEPDLNPVPDAPELSGDEAEDLWETTDVLNLNSAEKSALSDLEAFNYSLLGQMSKMAQVKGEDFSVSPVSLSIYLGMLANSTEGDARQQILDMLGVNDLDMLNAVNEKLMHYLPSDGKGVSLDVYNRLWLSDRYTAQAATAQKLKSVFNADIKSVDFTDQSTIPAINAWVSQKTQGLIPVLFSGDWTQYTQHELLSANTVYFKGDWASKFDKNATRKQDFHGFDATSSVDMMHQDYEMLSYAMTDKAQVVRIPYKAGQAYMDLYLPAENVDVYDLVADLKNVNRSGLTPAQVDLTLPKFESRKDNDNLNSVLANMGFTAQDAMSFAPMGINGASKKHDVIQKTYIKVDEDGTEMAAATGGSLGSVAPGTFPKVSLTFDRPFFYVIRDAQSNSMLVAGVVSKL